MLIRSIPACAGEPWRGKSACTPRRSQVYPRVCGGTGLGVDKVQIAGSRSIPACAGEPVVREYVVRIVGNGSIPACAGEPLLGPVGHIHMLRVYPRVCGGT